MKRRILYNKWIVIAFFFVFSLTIRLGRLYFDNVLSRDANLYIKMAEIWNEDGMNAAYSVTPSAHNIPPLLPLLMHLAFYIGLSPEFAGIMISLVVGSAMAPIAYFISERIFKSKVVGLYAGLLMAVQPVFIQLSADLLRDGLYIGIVTLAVFVAIYAIDTGRSWAWGVYGILSALALTTRKEGVELLLIFVVFALAEGIIQWRKGIFLGREIYVPVIAFAICYCSVLACFQCVAATAPDCYWGVIHKHYFPGNKYHFIDNEQF